MYVHTRTVLILMFLLRGAFSLFGLRDPTKRFAANDLHEPGATALWWWCGAEAPAGGEYIRRAGIGAYPDASQNSQWTNIRNGWIWFEPRYSAASHCPTGSIPIGDKPWSQLV